MEKRLKNYLVYMEKLCSEDVQATYAQEEKLHLKEELLIQIGFFQHERLIHLIVTVVFAILTMLSLLGNFLTDTPALLVMTVLFLVLLVPYVCHYYILENGVQQLYQYYDVIEQLSGT